jgi:hypothetical protein
MEDELKLQIKKVVESEWERLGHEVITVTGKYELCENVSEDILTLIRKREIEARISELDRIPMDSTQFFSFETGIWHKGSRMRYLKQQLKEVEDGR